MAMEVVFAKRLAAQWNGQDSNDVQAALVQLGQVTGNTWSVVSNDGQVLVLRETAPGGMLWADRTMAKGQVIVVDTTTAQIVILSAPDFMARYVRTQDVTTTVLTAGLNNPAWLAALATKLGLPAPPP
jgi:hypothetical protein